MHVIIYTRAHKRFSLSMAVRDTSFYVGAGRFTTFSGLGKSEFAMSLLASRSSSSTFVWILQ